MPQKLIAAHPSSGPYSSFPRALPKPFLVQDCGTEGTPSPSLQVPPGVVYIHAVLETFWIHAVLETLAPIGRTAVVLVQQVAPGNTQL